VAAARWRFTTAFTAYGHLDVVKTKKVEIFPSAGQLRLRTLVRGPLEQDSQILLFHTDSGQITGKYHPAKPPLGKPTRAVVWVGGSGGGLDGPAGALYPETCSRLQKLGMASLRLHYRQPNDLPACVLDVLLAVRFLRAEGIERVALVGHSFGGAVVITAGALSADVTAVVSMSTQTYGSDLAPQVSPRPLLLIHGADDEVLSSRCSEIVYAAARDPKELKLFPGARHGLDSVREEVLNLLTTWLDQNT
jgi:pimeloyl-ACP methyl ester carboxylesterase